MNITRVLVVDDKEENLYFLRALFQGHGIEVATAPHGAAALEQARARPPDLVIADILMPVMDGFTLCREWKADPRLQAIPFIFYTATYTDDRDRDFALSLGADRFLVKPLEPEEFMANIRETLREIAQAPVRSSRPPAPVGEVVFLQQYNERLVRKLESKIAQLEAANRELERDLAERRRIEADLRAAKEAAERANRAKTFFLANMSHEIRTPMNAVMGFSELMLGTTLDATQRQWMDVIRSRSRDLLVLVSDILDLARIEAGQLELAPKPFRVDELVREAAQMFDHAAQEKNLDLATEVAPDLPDMALGDPVRLRQILVNLIGNAVKFTERGRVSVRAVRQPAGQGTDGGFLLRVEVHDTGIGIPAAQQAMIFESFARADNAQEPRYGGTGLGLAISRRLAEMMGGSIGCESELGRGSVFHVTVRLRETTG
jgi:signal transduction histidine kinase